jgi:DNA-binding CsgD family transcriptional regulator
VTARAAARATLATGDGLPFAPAALGFLELGLGHADEAAAQLAAIEPLLEGSGLEEPALVPWAPDLVEAHVRRGDEESARRVLATLERRAHATRGAFAGAAAARGRGMLDERFDVAFAAALAHDDRRPMPFERARTLLAYGQRLHRARRRTEARERLREARAGFAALGADAWVAQADGELRAAGARRRPARSDLLTPQEARVATAVGRGLSNRQVAAELFLSPRTIEFHLRQIYRKLGIHSRAQLIRRWPKPQ